MRRVAVVALLVVGALVVTVAGGLRLASRSGALDGIVRERIQRALRDAFPGARVELGSVGGMLGRRLVVRDLRVAVNGRTVVRVPELDIVYEPLALLRRRLELRRVVVTRPRVRAVRADGRWRLPDTASAGEAEGGLAVHIERLQVRGGRLAVALLDAAPARRLAATRIAMDAAARLDGARRVLTVGSLRFVPRGIAVSRVQASGVLEQLGTAVEVARFHVATARSRLDARGRIEPGRRVDARADLTLAASELRALVPDAALSTALRARARSAGPWEAVALSLAAETSAAGRVRGGGWLDLGSAPLAWRTRLRFTDVDPGAAIPDLLRARASGTLEARGAGVGRAAPLAYHLALDDSAIAGQPVSALSLRGEAHRGVHHARAVLRVPAGEARLRAGIALAPPVRYRLGGRVAVDDIEAFVTGLPGQARMRVAGRGHGVTAEARRAELQVTLADALVRGVRVTQGQIGAWLEGDRLALGPVQVAGPGLWATGGGTLDLARREADVTIAIGLDEATGVVRSARVDARLRGPLDALAVAATANAEAIAWGTARATRADARLELTGVGGSTPRGTLHATAAAVTAAGWAAGDVSTDVAWQRSPGVDRGDVALTARDHEQRTQELALHVEHTAAATRGELTTLALTPPAGPRWRLAGPARFAIADGVDIEDLRLVAGEQALVLRGRIERTGTSAATLEVTRVRIAPLCELAGAPTCQGDVSGRATLGGTAASPRLEATLAAADVRVEDIPYGRLEATLAYADTSATLRADLDHPGAGMLHLEGRVPVDLAWAGPRRHLRDAPVALAARADALDLTFLRSLAPQELRATGGVLSLDLRISGTWAALIVDGSLRVDGGRLELAAAGLPYEDISLELRASGRSVEVVTLRAEAGDGRLEGSGHIDLGGERPLALALRLQEFFALRRRAYEAVVSGTVDVGGTLGTPDVTGTVDVERFLLRPGNLPASGPSLERDPTIVVRGGTAPAAPPAPAASTAVTDPMRLAIDVRIARNAWIRRADASIELAGDLRVEKEPYEPIRVGGQITLRRGWYVFQGRRFVIDDGRVVFTGAVPPDPALFVTASYDTRDYRVIVQVGGSASKPTLTLSSEPPLDQADILAVVLFGKPTNALGRSETAGLQQQALEISTGYVAPDLRESVMTSLGLHVFDVEVPQDDTTPGRVSVGRYVTGDVFVSLAQEFGAQQAEVMSVEYSLTRRFSIRGSTSTRGDSAIDVFWRRRY